MGFYAVPHATKITLLPGLREHRSNMNRDSVGHPTSTLKSVYRSCISASTHLEFDLTQIEREEWWTPDDGYCSRRCVAKSTECQLNHPEEWIEGLTYNPKKRFMGNRLEE